MKDTAGTRPNRADATADAGTQPETGAGNPPLQLTGITVHDPAPQPEAPVSARAAGDAGSGGSGGGSTGDGGGGNADIEAGAPPAPPAAEAGATPESSPAADAGIPAGDAPAPTAPRGAFAVFLDLDPSGAPLNLRLKPRDDLEGEVPADQASLVAAIRSMEHDLGCILVGSGWRTRENAHYLRELHDIAEIGVAKQVAQVGLATEMLNSLKREIVLREAGPFKAKLLRKLGIRAGQAAAIALSIALLAMGLDPAAGATPPAWLNDPDYTLIQSLALLLAGCSVGVWLSVGMRQPTMEFDELAQSDQDRLGPVIRIAFVGALTLVLATIFHAEILQVDIGAVDTALVFSSPLVAILIGVFCGLSEQALSARIATQATQFMRSSPDGKRSGSV